MDIKQTIAEISRTKWSIENALEENGGELTPELLAQYDTLEEMKTLLAGEGIDELGRWLKSVQDEIAARKAEADAAARMVKNLKGYEDYVKGLIGQAMDLLDLPTNKAGEKVAKGSFYGFKRTTSHRTAVDMDAINDEYLERAETAARQCGIPEYIRIELKATATDIKDWMGEHYAESDGTHPYLITDEAPALSFTKPRANKEA